MSDRSFGGLHYGSLANGQGDSTWVVTYALLGNTLRETGTI